MASIPTSPAPKTTTFLTFSASSLILIASSKFLNPTTFLASLKFSTGGMNAEAPVANNILSYFKLSPFERPITCSLSSIDLTSKPFFHSMLYFSKKSLSVKSKASISLWPLM